MHELRSTILGGEQKRALVASKAGAKSDAAPAGGLTRIAIKRTEARVTDQRLEDRHRNVVEQAVMVLRRKKHPVGVSNVSSRGAMLVADLEPRIGEKVDVIFADQNKTRCAVRWVREGRIGVEFLNETIFWENGPTGGPVLRCHSNAEAAPAAGSSAPADERFPVERQPRQRLLRSGSLYWNGITVPVRLRNISKGGARLDSEQELHQGCEVELDLGEAGYQMAEVRWSKDGQVGLRFAEDFDLDSLAPSEPGTAERAPDVLKPAYLETELQPDSPWAARFERLTMTELRTFDPNE
jgi:hypothetical protein